MSSESETEFDVPALSTQAESSSSSESEDDVHVKKGRKLGSKNRKWILIQSFQAKDDFDRWWTDEVANRFAGKSNANKNEDVDNWVCRYSKLKGHSCKVCLRIVFPYADDSVRVYQSDGTHTHEAERAWGLSEMVKQRIRQMTKQGLTAKRIHVQFTEEKLDPLPALEKIQWFVGRQRKPNSEPVTDNQLREYCERMSTEPEDENTAFVLAYDVPSTKSFYIVWTTKKLLERQLASKHLQADATSSVNWHNWPLLVLGHSDLNRHCIATLLAVGKSEDTYVYSGVFRALKDRGYDPDSVLSDGAGAITAACKQHFPRALRLMCFPHLIRRVDVHKKSLPAELQQAFRSDICMLQYSRSNAEFCRVSQLMVETWMDSAHASVPVFATYFNETWLESELCRWSEGESTSCLNNNVNESVNLRIKTDHTVRKMQSFPLFIEKVEKLLNYWAVNLRAIPTERDIPLKVFKAAFELQKECEAGKRLYIKLREPTKYVFASAKSTFTNNEEMLKAYNSNWTTLLGRIPRTPFHR